MVTTRLNAQLAPLSVCETGLNLGGGGGREGVGRGAPLPKSCPPWDLQKRSVYNALVKSSNQISRSALVHNVLHFSIYC